jgi:trigger factor
MIIRSTGEAATQDETDKAPDEWPFPGFSQNLIGLSSNDEIHLEYIYPEDSNYSTLKGVEAEFQVKVETVKSRLLPDVDDEFAKTIGEYDTLEALQKDIRESLENQAREAYNETYDEEILDAAIEQTVFKYPPEMVEHEIETVISEFRRRLERQGMDLDLYLKSRGIDIDGFKEEVQPVAEGRIKRALFLVELGRVENIEVKSEELEQETYSTMDYLYNTLPERDTRKLSQRDVYTNIVGNILADMLSRRSLERFREICSGGLSKVESAVESIEVAQDETTTVAEEINNAQIETEPASPSIVENDVAEEPVVGDSAA